MRGRSFADSRGAVLVEFMFAFAPMLLMLFCFGELMRMTCAKMALRYAASVGVRAAAVRVNANPDDVGNRAVVRSAVEAALGRWAAVSFFPEILVDAQIASPTSRDPNALDVVKVDARYACAVPMARRILCAKGNRPMTVRATFPHQGAAYRQ